MNVRVTSRGTAAPDIVTVITLFESPRTWLDAHRNILWVCLLADAINTGVPNRAFVIFSYSNRNTDFTEKSFVRVDVTEEFPFLVEVQNGS